MCPPDQHFLAPGVSLPDTPHARGVRGTHPLLNNFFSVLFNDTHPSSVTNNVSPKTMYPDNGRYVFGCAINTIPRLTSQSTSSSTHGFSSGYNPRLCPRTRVYFAPVYSP